MRRRLQGVFVTVCVGTQAVTPLLATKIAVGLVDAHARKSGDGWSPNLGQPHSSWKEEKRCSE